jgi:hypothetical protein
MTMVANPEILTLLRLDFLSVSLNDSTERGRGDMFAIEFQRARRTGLPCACRATLSVSESASELSVFC